MESVAIFLFVVLHCLCKGVRPVSGYCVWPAGSSGMETGGLWPQFDTAEWIKYCGHTNRNRGKQAKRQASVKLIRNVNVLKEWVKINTKFDADGTAGIFFYFYFVCGWMDRRNNEPIFPPRSWEIDRMAQASSSTREKGNELSGKEGKDHKKVQETQQEDIDKKRRWRKETMLWGLWDNPENSGQMLLWAKSPSKAEKGVVVEETGLHCLTTPQLSDGEQEKRTCSVVQPTQNNVIYSQRWKKNIILFVLKATFLWFSSGGHWSLKCSIKTFYLAQLSSTFC